MKTKKKIQKSIKSKMSKKKRKLFFPLNRENSNVSKIKNKLTNGKLKEKLEKGHEIIVLKKCF